MIENLGSNNMCHGVNKNILFFLKFAPICISSSTDLNMFICIIQQKQVNKYFWDMRSTDGFTYILFYLPKLYLLKKFLIIGNQMFERFKVINLRTLTHLAIKSVKTLFSK